MNKKLVTLAVAAAMAAPAAAMADATLYGKLNVGISYMDQEDGFNGWGLSDNKAIKSGWVNQGTVDGDEFIQVQNPFVPTAQGPANRIGVKGSEDLGNGLKAIYQIELGFSLSDSNNNGAVGNEAITMRNTFAGLAGGWGTVLAGRHDTPLKISTGPLDLFADTMADYNNTVGFMDIRADNAIAYISPSFSGFTFAAAVHAGGGATALGTGQLEFYDPITDKKLFGSAAGYNQNANSLADAYSFAGIYKNGPWYASLAYEGLNGNLACDTDWCDAETWGKWRVGLGILDWNGFSLTGIYEGWDNGYWVDGAKADLWNVQAGYTFGNFMVKAMYGSNTQKDIAMGAGIVENLATGAGYDACAGCTDDFNYKTWTFGVDYNMSKRTKAFLLYTANDADELDLIDAAGNYAPQTQGIDWNGFQLGMMHNF